jgi:excinuclease ABC subunit C
MMLKEKIINAPSKPGVYIFKGQKNRVLYVGKGKNLKNRLKTYFQRPETLDQRKRSMIELIIDFTYIITENELEALILEANLIKQFKPRFNIILRDDKQYPYLKLTIRDRWPRLDVVRRISKDGSMYFGPYVPTQIMWDALSFIRRNYPIRTCKYSLDKPMRPCIQYQMGRCTAPCDGKITRDDYMKIVDEVKLFLKGKRGDLLRNLEQQMTALSNGMKFEEAARIRDRMNNLKRLWESQRVIAPELGDIDIIGFYSDKRDAVFFILFVRNGILIGTKDFYLKDGGMVRTSEAFYSFIELFYAKEILPPEEIIVGFRPDNTENLKEWLRTKKDGRVNITVPNRGTRLELLKMANENAEQFFNSRQIAGTDEVLKDIQNRLSMPFMPHSLGAFDISTTSGKESVGAFIYWHEGDFSKEMYRHLRIKGVSGIDDYSMMNEVITRTLKNMGDHVPDLIIVDGGRGHLQIARDVLETNKITRCDNTPPMLIAIAKDPDRIVTSSDVIDLEDGSRSSLLLKKIRDEVHRFAISYHKTLRQKSLMTSPLEKIHGIGKKRRLELLRYFGSIEDIRGAPVDTIAKLKGFNIKVAENLLHELRRQ